MEHQTSIGRWFKSGSKDFFCSTFLHALTGLTWHGQEEPMELYPASGTEGFQPFLDSIVVSISACHVEGPGSIPGRGVLFSVPNTSSSGQRGEGANFEEN